MKGELTPNGDGTFTLVADNLRIPRLTVHPVQPAALDFQVDAADGSRPATSFIREGGDVEIQTFHRDGTVSFRPA